jgi:Uma2 family endonuclease
MFSPVIEIPAETPRSIVLHPPLSDAEFERLCEKSDFAFLERSKEGAIIVNAPAGGMTSDGNREITTQISLWWKNHRRGRVLDSSAGFFLPDGSVLSPDASYVTAEQLKGLSRDELARFLRLAPSFVIKLRSESDRLPAVTEKIKAWMANEVELGWLVDPYAREVHIYEAGVAAPRIEKGPQASGSGPVAGFVLDLAEVWRCYE